MFVTKIERQKRHGQRVNVYLDDAFAFGIHEEVLVNFGIKKGDHLTPQSIKEIESAEEFNLAKEKAFRLLHYRLRSEQELRRRLEEQEFHPAVIDKTIERMRSAGIIDDNKFARAFVHQLLMRKPAGKALLQRELRARGISKETIEEIVHETLGETEEQRLAREAVKKIMKRRHSTGNPLDEKKQNQKIANFLLRRGFGWATIKSILQSFSDNQTVEE